MATSLKTGSILPELSILGLSLRYISKQSEIDNEFTTCNRRRNILKYFKPCVDLGRDESIYSICVTAMHERTKRMILLKRVFFAAKRYSSHLLPESGDYRIILTLIVEVRVSRDDRLALAYSNRAEVIL